MPETERDSAAEISVARLLVGFHLADALKNAIALGLGERRGNHLGKACCVLYASPIERALAALRRALETAGDGQRDGIWHAK